MFNYVFCFLFWLGFKSVTLENQLLTVKGEELEEEKIEKKLKKICKQKKRFLGCLSSK